MKVFVEEQRSPLWKLFLIAGVLLSIIIILFLKLEDVLIDAKSKIIISVSVILNLLLIILIFTVRLKTKIDELGIHYRYFPLHQKDRFISWSELEKAFLRKYNPILEYGGRGMRKAKFLHKKNGKAYSVSGNIGLQLVLKNGKKPIGKRIRQNDLNQKLN